jgi:serine protease Do
LESSKGKELKTITRSNYKRVPHIINKLNCKTATKTLRNIKNCIKIVYRRVFIMKNSEERKAQMKKIAKKGLTLSLCAALAGGIAAGSYEGVNRLNGWNQVEEVQAAINTDNKITLTKTESESDSETEAGTKNKGSLDVSDIVEEAMPSVVSITTKSVQEVQTYMGMFGYGGYTSQEQEVEGAGSGIIIGNNDDELLIVTNYHVVEDAETVSVSFIDNETYEAKVKGFDEEKDLAIVAVTLDDIEAETLEQISIAKIGSSDDLKIGEQVVAIGNAMGYGQSVTTGIVSAKNRRINSSTSQVETYSDSGTNLIQTDAAINPGNSGGALLNMDGEVIGINSAKLASTEVEGVGYAIAISDVSDVLENLMNAKTREKIEDGAHGVLQIKGASVSSEGHQLYGIPEGVFVSEIEDDGAADEAGITKNSIITKFDGKTITSIETLVSLLEYYEPGEEVEVTIAVLDGNEYNEKTVTVTLGSSEEQSESEDEDSDADDEDTEEDENGNEDRESRRQRALEDLFGDQQSSRGNR